MMHVLRFVFVLFALSWAHPALAEPGVCPDGRIDVNAASAPVLTRLKGVGAKTAAKIVADRAANGPFASVAAMQRVKGVGAKRVQSLAVLPQRDRHGAQLARQVLALHLIVVVQHAAYLERLDIAQCPMAIG